MGTRTTNPATATSLDVWVGVDELPTTVRGQCRCIGECHGAHTWSFDPVRPGDQMITRVNGEKIGGHVATILPIHGVGYTSTDGQYLTQHPDGDVMLWDQDRPDGEHLGMWPASSRYGIHLTDTAVVAAA